MVLILFLGLEISTGIKDGAVMIKKIILLALTFVLVCPVLLWANEVLKVMVFPFDVFSQNQLDHLRTGLKEKLAEKFKKDGIIVIDPKETVCILQHMDVFFDFELARCLVDKIGADIGILGSMTKVGSSFSIELKIVDVTGKHRFQLCFMDGIDEHNLTSIIDCLGHEINIQITSLKQELVANIKVKGSWNIAAETIKCIITTKVGDIYSPVRIKDDQRELWEIDRFQEVYIEVDDSLQGKIVTVSVMEWPTIYEIKIVGNNSIDDAFLCGKMQVKCFDTIKHDHDIIKRAVSNVVEVYRTKNYYDTKATASLGNWEFGNRSLLIAIDEGVEMFIKNIKFVGNYTIASRKLKTVMKTKEKSLVSWIIKDNLLDKKKLREDLERLTSYYTSMGYMNARLRIKEIKRGREGLVMIINVFEAYRIKVAAITISGDIVMPQNKLMTIIKTIPDMWYNRDIIYEDVVNLTMYYHDMGYIFAEIHAAFYQDTIYDVNVNFKVKKGKKYYLERIIINGNSETRDKVIRRTLNINEGDLFFGSAISYAYKRLIDSDFFENIYITMQKGSHPKYINLEINVNEKSTGQMNIGTGYSSDENFMLLGFINENNLLGYGQQVELRGQVGTISNHYNINFTDPWFLDKDISLGVDFYSWDIEYPKFSKEARGACIHFGFTSFVSDVDFDVYYTCEQVIVYDMLKKLEETMEEIVYDDYYDRQYLYRKIKNYNGGGINSEEFVAQTKFWQIEQDNFWQVKQVKYKAHERLLLRQSEFWQTEQVLGADQEQFKKQRLKEKLRTNRKFRVLLDKYENLTYYNNLNENEDMFCDFTTSAVRGTLHYDSRDERFNPTQGSNNSVSVEYAGGFLGGSSNYLKIQWETSWYIPLEFRHVVMIHGRIGWVTSCDGYGSKFLPVYERFFLGGRDTLRGYGYMSVSSDEKEDYKNDDDISDENEHIGGQYMALANIEYRFPVVPELGLEGVFFYDTGNCWKEEDGYNFNKLKSSVGTGIRWLSPLGQIRLEFGYILNPKLNEKRSSLDFSFGSPF